MSGTATRTFLPALRELERRLDAPIPDRVRILRELEADLDALHAEFVERGMSSEDARRAALEALVPGDSAAGALGCLATPSYRRWTRNVRPDRLATVERRTLAALTAVVLVLQATALLRARLLDDPSAFLWPVLSLGCLLFALSVTLGFRLWIKRDHRDPGRGIGLLLGVSAFTLLLGVTGAFVDTYRFAAMLEASPDLAATLTTAWLVRTSALVAVSIVLCAAGALSWYVLDQWTASMTAARREALGIPGHALSHDTLSHDTLSEVDA